MLRFDFCQERFSVFRCSFSYIEPVWIIQNNLYSCLQGAVTGFTPSALCLVCQRPLTTILMSEGAEECCGCRAQVETRRELPL